MDGKVQREVSIPEIERYCARFRRKLPKKMYQRRDQPTLDFVDPKTFIQQIYDALGGKDKQ